MEKKSSVKEVHKLVQQDYPELYKKIAKILGDDNPFAKFNIGAGIYIWADNRCNWHQMIAWSSLKQEDVRETLSEVKARLTSQFGEKQTELLMTVPDEGYIYFNDDEGDLKVLLTGWGFKKPVRVDGKPIIEEIVNKNQVTLSFIYNGERLPNYPFGLRLSNRARKLHTDAQGICNMGNLCDGEKYIIYDIKNDNKIYNLQIVSGQSHYDIDLTKRTTLHLSATTDGTPVCNELIDIQYHGNSYTTNTDSSGHATLEIPLYENEILSANLMGQSKSINVRSIGNNIDFVFKTPPAPEPSIETDVLVTVILDSNVCPNNYVIIEYKGQTFTGSTDENGQFVQHLEIANGEICKVSVEDYTTQQRELNDNPINEFRFEKTTPPIVLDPIKFTPKLIVKRENGDIVANYPITIEADNYNKQHITDINGEAILPEMEENVLFKVIDGNNQLHAEEYTVLPKKEEYIFTIPDETVLPERQLKLMFRNKEDNPIQCKSVIFHQEGRDDINVTLDENGEVCMPRNTFKDGNRITASIDGWEENYDPIPFITEENEDEYLLQEKAPERSWWKLIPQILTVTATICAVIALWPILEGFCMGFFQSIYS